MTGFDNRTLQSMQRHQQMRQVHEAGKQEANMRIARERQELATRAISAHLHERTAISKQSTYESCVTNMLELAHAGHDSQDITSEDLQIAASLVLEDPRVSYLERNIAAIYEAFPAYASALALNESDEYLSREEFRNNKRPLSQFNKVLKDFIDGDPRIQPDELQHYLQDCALTYGYSGEELALINRHIPLQLRGMMHELGFESLLYRLDGIDIEDVTTEDDLNGIDSRIIREDGTDILIDVKASQTTAEKARSKRERAHMREYGQPLPSNILIVASGFLDSSFSQKYPWRPTEEAIARALPRIQTIIEQVPKQ